MYQCAYTYCIVFVYCDCTMYSIVRICCQITLITPKCIHTEYTVLKIFSPFRMFEELALALKNKVCLENFHCIEYTFRIQYFWTTCACPEKQSCPEIFQPGGGCCSPAPQPRTPMVLDYAQFGLWFLDKTVFLLAGKVMWNLR